jgi:hypothetical protein
MPKVRSDDAGQRLRLMNGVIVFFAVGALMALISLRMALKPANFADSIVTFSEWRWFHAFEVVSRLVIGFAFIGLNESFVYPTFATGFGYLLVAVGIGLVILGRAQHERFARWTATLGAGVFRPAGAIGVALGVLLAYLALPSA